ncbi:MAG: hypothetical protein V1787_05755 [Candidatus Micrarchaeota archaeon]
MRAFFSWDVLFAAVAVTAMAAILVSAFSIQSSRVAFQRSLESRQAEAMLLADFILKRCPEDGGLLRCEGRAAFSNELSPGALEAFNETTLQKAAAILGIRLNASVKVFALDGDVLLQAKSVKGLCVRRPALLEGRTAILEACIGG